MEIKCESRISHPREVVFSAYRDRLPEVVSYIPDIREIKVLSREEDGSVVKLHNEWISDRDVPSFAKRILKPEYLRWDDYASWDQDQWICEWEIKTRAFTDAVHCKGRNIFTEEDGGTRLQLTGDLTINLKEIPGVPRFLAGSLAPRIEKFIVSLITPNLEQVNKSLQQFLDEQG